MNDNLEWSWVSETVERAVDAEAGVVLYRSHGSISTVAKTETKL